MSDDIDNFTSKRCPKCYSGVMKCTGLKFVDDPVLKNLGGFTGTIAGSIMGTGIGEIITWTCPGCKHEEREAVYIGANLF